MRLLKWSLGGLFALILGVVMLGVATGWYLSTPVTPETTAKMLQSNQFKAGKFVNIEPEAGFEISIKRVAEQFESHERQIPTGPFPVIPLKPESLKNPPAPGLRMAWLGHAGVLMEVDGKRILTDPILSERASPFTFAGPKRFHEPPISFAELTGIDAVIISHNHYDHLDRATVTKLADLGTKIYVPLGNRPQLLAWKIAPDQVIELDWWQEVDLGGVRIIATPARHYSSRGLFDYKETLWASWSIVGSRHRVFFSGDTGYSKVFREIGQKIGPFDLTLIKIGSYGPGQMWRDIHMPPEESIQTHLDVQGARMLPIHWGTFDLGNHAWDEPILRTLSAADQAGVHLVTPRVGEWIDPKTHTGTKWWEALQ